MTDLTRRTILRGAAGTFVLGAVAGCTGDGGGNGEDGGDDGGDDGNGGGGPAERADTWLSDNNANLYDGSLADHTGEDEVTVMVGAGDNDLAFDPAGIRVDTGTNIVWEWTGEGGGHNVVPQGDTDFEDFGVDDTHEEEGFTIEHTFEESGVALYLCQPHQAQGMYGAVVVE